MKGSWEEREGPGAACAARRRGLMGVWFRLLHASAWHELWTVVLRHAGELTGENIEIGIVGPDRKFRVLTAAEISDYLQEVE